VLGEQHRHPHHRGGQRDQGAGGEPAQEVQRRQEQEDVAVDLHARGDEGEEQAGEVDEQPGVAVGHRPVSERRHQADHAHRPDHRQVGQLVEVGGGGEAGPPRPIEHVAEQRQGGGVAGVDPLLEAGGRLEELRRELGLEEVVEEKSATNPTTQTASHRHWGRSGTKQQEHAEEDRGELELGHQDHAQAEARVLAAQQGQEAEPQAQLLEQRDVARHQIGVERAVEGEDEVEDGQPVGLQALEVTAPGHEQRRQRRQLQPEPQLVGDRPGQEEEQPVQVEGERRVIERQALALVGALAAQEVLGRPVEHVEVPLVGPEAQGDQAQEADGHHDGGAVQERGEARGTDLVLRSLSRLHGITLRWGQTLP
jgi:hypothetical protein